MATKHKAPTQVTLAPHEERSGFQDFVHRHWPKGAVVAVIVAAAILFTSHSRREARQARLDRWGQLASVVDFQTALGPQLPASETLAQLADEHAGDITGPWARALEVARHIEDRDYVAAKSALERLKADFPDHPIVRGTFVFEEDGAPSDISTHVGARLGALQLWERDRSHLFENPALPDGAPRVKVTTSAGAIVLGLYAERAPKHVENFLKLCREGYYDGTVFHRVVKGFMVQGGDPNSREADTSTWGQGGPDYKVEAETDNGLSHFKSVLAAAKQPGETDSSGSQFYVTTGTPHHLDGQHTVFGTLLEGEDVIATIEDGEIAQGDRPSDPISIRSTEVL